MVALDADRLAQLSVFSETELRTITADVIDAVAEQLARIETALGAADLASAADAAHRARNETLLVGAVELSQAFTSLEQAARGGAREHARRAAVTAQDLWPATRAAIARVRRQLQRP